MATQADIIKKGQALLKQYDFEALLITCGKEGMVLVQQQQPPLCLSAKAQDVYDVTGAGDTVIAVMAAAIAAGEDYARAAELANTAAGLVVAKLGAANVSVAELEQALAIAQPLHQGVLAEDNLLFTIANAKAKGEKNYYDQWLL